MAKDSIFAWDCVAISACGNEEMWIFHILKIIIRVYPSNWMMFSTRTKCSYAAKCVCYVSNWSFNRFLVLPIFVAWAVNCLHCQVSCTWPNWCTLPEAPWNVRNSFLERLTWKNFVEFINSAGTRRKSVHHEHTNKTGGTKFRKKIDNKSSHKNFTYRISIISPRSEFHETRLLIEWKIFDINFTKWFVYRRWLPDNFARMM